MLALQRILNFSLHLTPFSAMKAALDAKGDLINLRTRLEEDVLVASGQLQYQSEHKGFACTSMSKRYKPAMPHEIILANNLISQYLDHVGLQNTSAVLSSGEFN